MSSARSQILAGLAQARNSATEEARLRVDQRLHSHPANLIPARGQLTGKALSDLFCAMAIEVNATLDHLGTFAEIPQALARFIASHHLDLKVKIAPAPDLQDLDWSKCGLAVEFGRTQGADLVALSRAMAGVAETGSLVMCSGPASPTTLCFLPDFHVVALKASEIKGDYETVWQDLRGGQADIAFPPRTVHWITGPSRTADIEQTLLLGAHGPRSLHILLIDDV